MKRLAMSRDTMSDLLECTLSVLLAIVLAHWCGAHNVGWAAFSAYMVMRSRFTDSAMRGGLRILGTAVGAALALLYGLCLPFSPAALCLALALVGGATLYCALLSHHGYAWLFTGLTFAMVLVDGMQQTGRAMEAFAKSRFMEVLVGTAAAVLVSAGAALVRRHAGRAALVKPASATEPVAGPAIKLRWWQPAALFHVAQAGIALGLIPWVWYRFGISSLSQSCITIMAVMMAPLATLSNLPGLHHSKSLQRFVGCAVGGLLAIAILLACHSSMWIMLAGVCIGVLIGRYVENQVAGFAYVGTQFALAFLVVLVPDNYGTADAAPGILRLSGILFGLLLLLPVRLLFRLLQRGVERRLAGK